MSEILKAKNKESKNVSPSTDAHEEAGAIGMAIGGFAGGLLGSLARASWYGWPVRQSAVKLVKLWLVKQTQPQKNSTGNKIITLAPM